MSVFSGRCVKRLLLAMLEKMKERWDGSAGRKGKRRGMPSMASPKKGGVRGVRCPMRALGFTARLGAR